MNAPQRESLLAITLMTAFADGGKSDAERAEVRRIAESLDGEGMDLPRLYQDVLMKRITLEAAVGGLASEPARQLAYELAVCVADADGVQNDSERRFLEELRGKLGLQAQSAALVVAQAESVAAAPLERITAVEPRFAANMAAAEMDAMILNYAILNGALELLPETLASLAIIPLQMKMVHRVGKAHGFELDQGHVKDFLLTAGVGLTSQYVEQVGARIVGKLFGGIGGRLLGGLASQAVSSGFSFATTYALGHVAKRYYEGGRSLSSGALKAAYSDVLGEAKALQARHLPDIRQKAQSLDLGKLLSEIGK